MPLLDAFFIGEHPGELVLNEGLLGAPIRYPLSVWFCSHQAEHRLPENRAITSLLRGLRIERPWYGVVVALKYGGTRCSSYVDITEFDLGHIAAYFMGAQ